MPRVKTRTRRPAPVTDALAGLGDRIRKARIEAGLSQAQLGAPNFTRAHLSAIELSKVRPAMKTLEFIAAKLGKPASFFIQDEGEERRRKERELDIDTAAALVNFTTAGEAVGKLRPLLDVATSPRDICRIRLLLGTSLNILGKGPDAISDLTVAERIAAQLGNDPLRRSAQYQSAIAMHLSGDAARSRDILAALLKELDSAKPRDMLFRTKVLKDLGTASYRIGDHAAANAYYLSALEWAKDVGDASTLITIYWGLASTYRAAGDLETATTYLQRALSASELANDLGTIAAIHNELAVIAAERDHLEAAYRHTDRAISLARASGPAAYVAHSLVTKAECAVRGGDWKNARAAAEEALSLATTPVGQRAAAAARVVLAEVELESGEKSRGEQQLKEAAAIYKMLGAAAEHSDVLMRLSKVARELGDSSIADKYAAQAYRLIKPKSGIVER